MVFSVMTYIYIFLTRFDMSKITIYTRLQSSFIIFIYSFIYPFKIRIFIF